MPSETCARLDQAIDALWALAVSDDVSNLDTYKRQIAALRFKKIDCQFAAISERSAILQAAAGVLEQALAIASGVTPSDVLQRVKELIDLFNGPQAKGDDEASEGPVGRLAMGSTIRHLPAGRLRVLCVHGVGDHRDGEWKKVWTGAMQAAVDTWNPKVLVDPIWCDYDDLVLKHGDDASEYAEALLRLGWSWVKHGIGDIFRRRRGLGDVAEAARWRVGMVAQWTADKPFREATRQRLMDDLKQAEADGPPIDAIFAHSLGSLVSYDAYLHDPDLLRDRTLVLFGSQVGHPTVRDALGGKLIAPPPRQGRLVQLYNPLDRIFTEPIVLQADSFRRIETRFDSPGPINHDADRYLTDENAVSGIWRVMVSEAQAGRSAAGKRKKAKELAAGPFGATAQQFRVAARTPDKRALLIGINDYQHRVPPLRGCVNDVFLTSALLQEMSFEAEQVRVLLNHRATAAAIFERLDWLLDDVRPGDQRVLYFSGHGSQLPTYNLSGEPDHLDECLVPHDFDFSHETAITDDALADRYANLPYESQVVVMLDCCHASGQLGGDARGGGAAVRGVVPPDDIRHRAIYWDQKRNMWLPRELRGTLTRVHIEARDTQNRKRSAKTQTRQTLEESIVGKSGVVHRLGGSAHLRGHKLPSKNAKRPFMPMVLSACGEAEQAFEYEHGVESYGAFTWSIASVLRQRGDAKKQLTFAQLVKDVQKHLKTIGFDQTPDLRGPSA